MARTGNMYDINVSEAVYVRPRVRNFELDCTIDADDMGASVTVITSDDSCDVSEFDILCRMYVEGVREGVDYKTVSCIVADRKYNKPVAAAAGFPPEKGKPAEITAKIRLEEFSAKDIPSAKGSLRGVMVSAGQILAEKTPADSGEIGVDVRGRRLEPAPGRDARFKFGENVFVSDDGLRLMSEIDGLAGLDNGKIVVKDKSIEKWKESLTVSEDKMEAVLSITPGASKQPEYSEKWLEGLIKKAGIKFGIEKEAFKKIPKRIDKPVKITVAKGERPTRGREAQVVERYKEKTSGGTPWSVEKGQLIAEKIPTVEGAPGRNVFDERVPAAYQSFVQFTAGEGARLSADKTKIFAVKEGCVRREKNTFSIVKCTEVDFADGERRVNSEGAIRIKGDVPRGCSIVAGHHVFIEGDVRESEVVAGGELHIAGRVVDCEKTKIQSGSDIYLNSATRSRVLSGGDILAKGTMEKCELIAEGCVHKQGDKKLSVAGGVVIAAGGVKVDGINVSAGSPARIVSGAPYHLLIRYEQSLRDISALAEKYKKATSEQSRLEKLARTGGLPPQDSVRLNKIKAVREILASKINLAKSGAVKLKKELMTHARSVKIEVADTAAAGTSFTIGPLSFALKSALSKFSVSQNETGDELIIKRL